MRNVDKIDEKELLKRRIRLKRQALPLIKDEIRQDQLRLALLELKGDLERQITETFDRELSQKLDAVNCLLEN